MTKEDSLCWETVERANDLYLREGDTTAYRLAWAAYLHALHLRWLSTSKVK
jgi:hypothetical protein